MVLSVAQYRRLSLTRSPLGSGKTIETVVIKIILTCLWAEGLSVPPPIWCVFQPRLASNLEDAIQFVTKNSYASDKPTPSSVLLYVVQRESA